MGGISHDLRGIWRKRQEMAGTDHPGWRLNNLTTTQRDALTGEGAAKAGDAIFNTTTGAFEVYSGSAWQSGGGYNSSNVGTVTTATTTAVTEYGSDIDHVTRFAMTAFAVGTGADAADKAIGAKFYTFPTGTIMVGDCSLKGIFDQASHGTITGGEAGIGTTVGVGVLATLGAVASTAENLIQGDVGVLTSYVLGTGVVQVSDQAGIAAPPLTILSAGVHDVYLNIAASWPNIAAPEAVTFTGVITLTWRIIS